MFLIGRFVAGRALVIPGRFELVPPGFADDIRRQLAAITCVDVVDEGRRRIAALRQYVTNRDNRVQLAVAERWCEVRIGELLGPAEHGGDRKSDDFKSPAGDLKNTPKVDRHKFRLLAANRDLVARLMGEGKVSRKGILEAISDHHGNGVTKPQEACGVSDLKELVGRGVAFGTIYADPPWQYGNQRTRAATSNHYETMTVEEIAALPVGALAADQSHLHLWTTNAFLRESFAIIDAWGFEYKSVFVWVKPQMGIGNYWRVSHEFLLLGVRGGRSFMKNNQMSWRHLKRGRHSSKPNEVRRIIEKVSPEPRLELFGRHQVDGWVVWGNQIHRDMFDSQARTLNE